MSYADSLLADGEHIIYRTKQHWLAPIAEARYGLGLLAVAAIAFFVGNWIGSDSIVGGTKQFFAYGSGILFLVALAWLGWVYLQWSAEDYIVTDRRVLKIDGIVNKHSADSSLDKINDAVVDQGLLGRIFGYASLEILTAAEEAVDRYSMLNHALVFKRYMLNAKHDMETGPRYAAPPLRAAAPAPAPAPAAAPVAPRHSADEVTTTLARLADLRDRGAITPEEYEAKKAELLAQI